MIKIGFSPNTRNRCWVGTIHKSNMEKAGLSKEQYENPEYLAGFFISLWENSGKGRRAGGAVCISNKGRYHMHIACYGNTTTLKKVSDTLFNSHVEPQLGGKDELRSYLLKEGKYEEKGEHVLYTQGLEVVENRQGKRNDLDEIEAMINDGYTPLQIFEESFRYRKYEKIIKAHYIQKRIKETPLIKTMWNEYHFGKSGSGKTYTYIRRCEECSPEEVYLCNDYANSGSSGGGFDFYSNNPAHIIVLDEFRGNIPFASMLSMLDVYSRNQQHARYQNVYNLWNSVIICSIFAPEEVYSFMVDDARKSVDSIRQFLRRINVIVYHYKDKLGHFRTFTLPSAKYKGKDHIIEKAIEFEEKVSYEEYLKNEGNGCDNFDNMRVVEGGEILL